MKALPFISLALLFVACQGLQRTSENQYDLLVYGATPAGVITAVTAADHGAKVLIVEPSPVVGGMYASGLNTAESEHMINSVITGRARDFFIRLGEENYDTAYFQSFGNGRGLKFKPGDPAFFFESKHAEALFETMLQESLRKETQSYGFCKDEFADNSHFQPYLYVREGRRMLGELVQTQRDIFQDRSKEQAVFLGSHWVDSHHVQRIALSDTTFVNEGRIWEVVHKPFEIDYRTLVPQKEECTNLIVPVCASYSHVAFCAYRLESTWMQAGHVAGLASIMAMQKDQAIQEIPVPELQQQLRSEGMIIKLDELPPYDDYDWMATHPNYKDWYDRMYEQGVDNR